MKVSRELMKVLCTARKKTQKHSGSKVFCIFNEKFCAHTRCINWMHALLALREVSSSNIHEHSTATCNGVEILQFLIIHAADERQWWGRFANISQRWKIIVIARCRVKSLAPRASQIGNFALERHCCWTQHLESSSFINWCHKNSMWWTTQISCYMTCVSMQSVKSKCRIDLMAKLLFIHLSPTNSPFQFR